MKITAPLYPGRPLTMSDTTFEPVRQSRDACSQLWQKQAV
jgi:hypothetical protein